MKAGGQAGDLNYLVNGSGTTLNGYREHSNYRGALLNSKFRFDLNDSSDLTVVLNAVDSPKAEDAGALTDNEVEEDPKQAAPRNLLFDAANNLVRAQVVQGQAAPDVFFDYAKRFIKAQKAPIISAQRPDTMICRIDGRTARCAMISARAPGAS